MTGQEATTMHNDAAHGEAQLDRLRLKEPFDRWGRSEGSPLIPWATQRQFANITLIGKDLSYVGDHHFVFMITPDTLTVLETLFPVLEAWVRKRVVLRDTRYL